MANQDSDDSTNQGSDMARNSFLIMPSIEKVNALTETLLEIIGMVEDPQVHRKLDTALELLEEIELEWKSLNISGLNNARLIAEIDRKMTVLQKFKERLEVQ